jgi:hypothetical protein
VCYGRETCSLSDPTARLTRLALSRLLA